MTFRCSRPSPYGKQEPKKYNYKGQPVTGSEKNEVSPYSILGLSATWDVTKYVSLTGGVDNVFDKRHWRAGNAQTTGAPPARCTAPAPRPTMNRAAHGT